MQIAVLLKATLLIASFGMSPSLLAFSIAIKRPGGRQSTGRA
jgi:hypothetical protein